MAIQTIGDELLPSAFDKINENFVELYAEDTDQAAALATLAARVTSIEQDPDVRRFDYDPDNSDGTTFAFFGGRYETLDGASHYLSDGTVVIASGTNYVELDYSDGVVKSNQVGFTDGRMRMWVAVSNGVTITANPTDMRPSDREVVSTGFGRNYATTTGLTYGYRAGTIRNDNVLTSVAAGTAVLTDNAVNYLEVDGAGTVSVNTTGFTPGSAPIATITTAAGAITAVADARGALPIVAADTRPTSSFFDPLSWVM